MIITCIYSEANLHFLWVLIFCAKIKVDLDAINWSLLNMYAMPSKAEDSYLINCFRLEGVYILG